MRPIDGLIDAGAKSGRTKQTSNEERRVVYTHCYEHALYLAACDVIEQSKIMGDRLYTTFEISKLGEFSPTRDSRLKKLKKELALHSLGLRVLCTTC